MRFNTNARRRAWLSTAVATALGVAHGLATAQEQVEPEEVESIVVTGTMIKGVAPVGAPVLSLDADRISAIPVNNTAELLRDMPQIPAIGPSDTGTGVGVQGAERNFSFGSSINIRGIGPSATLMLVNGRRVALSGLSGYFYDPTVISPEAIERIEVVPDGSSAIYGSDAVAGVVNIITHSEFDGVKANVRYGYADGFDQVRAGVIAGHSWDDGSAVVSYSYNERSILRGYDRDYFRRDLTAFGGGNYTATQAAPGTLTVNGVNYRIPDQNGIGLDPSELTVGTNRFDTGPLNTILPQQTYHNFTASLTHRFNDRLEFFVDGFYSKRDFILRSAAGGGVYTVPSTNPFFVSPVPGASSVQVAYNFTNDVGEGQQSGFAKNGAVSAGFDFDISDDWSASVSTTFADDKQEANLGGFSQLGLRGIIINQALADTNPETALNLFGNGTANNPETLARLYGTQGARIHTTMQNVFAKVDGRLFELPGGSVRVAFGGEYRREGSHNITEGNPSSPTLQRTADNDVDRSLNAVFGEVYVPIVGAGNAVPLVERLDLSVAVRREDYSDFGVTTNPKFGLTWSPVAGTEVRASYGTAFRAPTLVFMNPLQTTVQGNPLLVDPTSPTGTTYGIARTGGNPDLKPEEGTSWTLGVDWVVPFFDDLRLSLTHFSLDYDNIVGQVPPTALSQESLYADFITRNPPLQEVEALIAASPGLATFDPQLVRVIIDRRSNNLGSSKIRGLDFSGAYGVDSSVGKFDFSLGGVYYTKFENRLTATSPWADRRDLINWPTRYRLQGRATWNLDAWRAGIYVNYVPSYTNDLVQPRDSVDDWMTIDGQVRYEFAAHEGVWRGVSVALDFQNLFDKDPPFVDNPAGFGYDPQQANAMGRVMSLQLSKHW